MSIPWKENSFRRSHSTNFNDMGSLRYLYKYIEKNGAIDRLKELGLSEGDTIRIEDYDMEYWEE